MEEKLRSETQGPELLNQLEQILDSDPLIDELGFVHPSQIRKLHEEAASSGIVEGKGVDEENPSFWNGDHKLGISTEVLLPLYTAAKHAFVAAFTQYKTRMNLCVRPPKPGNGDPSRSLFSSQIPIGSEVMRHSKALLLLSSDFGTAWNSRKLVLSEKHDSSLYMDELLLSKLVLSYSPKSDHAWSHRRWAIKMVHGGCPNLQEIASKESELVEEIAEKSKMNYRAWNHRGHLVAYMTRGQVLHELAKSRNWAGLHVADNCCFHYRRRLLLSLLDSHLHEKDHNAASSSSSDMYDIWKEELDWNAVLIERYIGREALWLHRRFLSLCWIKHFTVEVSGEPCWSKCRNRTNSDTNSFLHNEMRLLQHYTTILDDSFEDCQAQAMLSATYILWLAKGISGCFGNALQKKLAVLDLKTLLNKLCAEKTLFWNYLLDLDGGT